MSLKPWPPLSQLHFVILHFHKPRPFVFLLYSNWTKNQFLCAINIISNKNPRVFFCVALKHYQLIAPLELVAFMDSTFMDTKKCISILPFMNLLESKIQPNLHLVLTNCNIQNTKVMVVFHFYHHQSHYERFYCLENHITEMFVL